MSKVVMIIPLAVVAAPFLGAAWLTKKAWDKGKALVASLSPEDRAYLLPFGADHERLKLEAATVSYRSLEGLDFGMALPAIEVPATGSLALSSANRMDEAALFTPAQEQAYKQVEAAAQAVGFKTEPRALPPESSVLVFDLIGLEQALDRRGVPVPRRPA